MSSLHRLSARDLESLSAYLDGELGPAETARLEGRLEREVELGRGLAELRATAEALGSLPVLRPPRPLTLSPRMVGLKEHRRPYPALQLATALATVAFLAVGGVNAVLSRGFGLGAAAPAPAAMLQEGAMTPESLQAPPAAPTEAEAIALGAEAPSADMAVTPTAEAAFRTVETMTPFYGIGGGPEATTVPGELSVEALPSPTASATPSPSSTPPPTPTETAAPTSEALALREAGAPPRPIGPSLLGWVELGLGATVVVLGVLTLRVRRKA